MKGLGVPPIPFILMLIKSRDRPIYKVYKSDITGDTYDSRAIYFRLEYAGGQ